VSSPVFLDYVNLGQPYMADWETESGERKSKTLTRGKHNVLICYSSTMKTGLQFMGLTI